MDANKSRILMNRKTATNHQIRLFGPGLTSGVLGVIKGEFYVTTCGGSGCLKVRVHGPKNSFRVELTREHPMGRMITVRYDPKVVGVYDIDVMWNDQNICGSPFRVYVAASPEA